MLKNRYKQLVITLLLFVASVVLYVYARGKVVNLDIEYEEVQVTFISAETERRSGYKYSSYSYHVTVEYEGKNYELTNVQSGEMPKYEGLASLSPELQYDNPYFDNTVYYSNGKLYSNIAGIKTDTNQFNWSMLGLAGIGVFGLLHFMCVVDIADKKKKLKQDDDDKTQNKQ